MKSGVEAAMPPIEVLLAIVDRLAQYLSLAANILLLVIKAWAFFISNSFAVLASMADSGVDLASQVVLFLCNRRVTCGLPRMTEDQSSAACRSVPS